MLSTDMMLAPSGLPEKTRLSVQKAIDRALGSPAIAKAKKHAIATAHTIRATGESAIVGGLLGAAHVELKHGLDQPVGKSTVPIDGVLGVALAGMAVILAEEDVSVDLRNAAMTAIGVCTFRKSYDVLSAKKVARGGVPGGTFGPRALSAHGDFGSDAQARQMQAHANLQQAARALSAA